MAKLSANQNELIRDCSHLGYSRGKAICDKTNQLCPYTAEDEEECSLYSPETEECEIDEE